MAMAIRGEGRAKEVVVVRMHIGNMEKTAAEVLVRARLELVDDICTCRFHRRRRGDRKGIEEGGERAQHDWVGPV